MLRRRLKLIASLPRVYVCMRQAEHGWWRGLNVCWRLMAGKGWKARDAGEMRAQLAYMAYAVRKAHQDG